MTELSKVTKAGLLGARDYIKSNGHFKGFYYDEAEYSSLTDAKRNRAPMCVMGAYMAATVGVHIKSDAYYYLEKNMVKVLGLDTFERRAGESFITTAWWNDHSDVSKEDVLDRLEKAAENLNE